MLSVVEKVCLMRKYTFLIATCLILFTSRVFCTWFNLETEAIIRISWRMDEKII